MISQTQFPLQSQSIKKVNQGLTLAGVATFAILAIGAAMIIVHQIKQNESTHD